MNRTRMLLHVMLGGMLLVPLFYLLETSLQAAPVSTSFQSDLLLTRAPSSPLFSEIHKLNRTIIATYLCQGREDLWSICKRFQTDQFTVRSSNDLDLGGLSDGTALKIPSRRGTLYDVEKPENLHAISQDFTVGKKLGAQYETEILETNDYPLPDLSAPGAPFRAGTILFLPDAWKPTGLPFPFAGNGQPLRITSRFGMRKHPILGVTRPHDGFDIAKPYGTPVMASRQGTVSYAGWRGGYGNLIEIRHVIKSKSGNHTYFTRYGHLSKIMVHEGQSVHMYQMIGRVGSTGISTGPHLHFEIRDENGVARNPGNFQ